MHKIHVTETYNEDLKIIFAKISDHAEFLTGGGIQCNLIKEGKTDRNGVGAIRKVVSEKLTFEEEITGYQENIRFSYLITSITPPKPIKHNKGWLDFKQLNGKTQVDWHSHFEVTTPIVGWIIGIIVKKSMAKVFQSRLKYIKSA